MLSSEWHCITITKQDLHSHPCLRRQTIFKVVNKCTRAIIFGVKFAHTYMTYTYITFIYSFLSLQLTYRSSHEICSIEKAVFKNFAISTGKHLCWSLFLIKLQACLQRTFTTDVSCEYCESFKNTYFEEHM